MFEPAPASVVGVLCLLAGSASATTQAAFPGQQPTVRRIVLLTPDTTRPPSFPDSTWSELREAAPGHTLGVRIEVIAADSNAAAQWLSRLNVSLYRAGAGRSRDVSLLAPAFFRGLFCAQGDCRVGGVFGAFGYAGALPPADTLLLLLVSPDSTITAPVWRRSPPRFVLGASVGAAVPLNSRAGRGIVRRVGLNGRLLIGTLHEGDLKCRVRSWPVCVFQAVTYLATLPAHLAPQAHKWQGPFVVEGDFLLGLVALQKDTSAADSTGTIDSTQVFRQSSEGYVRIELPLVDFGGEVSLRAFAQGGFVTVQSLPNYWVQQYFGLRLGMDAVDPSGRQSFVEIAYGLSENLRPKDRRLRVGVQLRVPDTGLVFQFNVNMRPGSGHLNTFTSDNPIVFSVYNSIDFKQLFSLVSGQPPN